MSKIAATDIARKNTTNNRIANAKPTIGTQRMSVIFLDNLLLKNEHSYRPCLPS